jgi:hypothetical protein
MYNALLVVTSFYDRVDTLMETVQYYDSIECVAHTRVIWHNPTTKPFDKIDAFVPLTNSLNNRFDPRAFADFAAALHVDDDTRLDPTLICTTFNLWKDHPMTIFAFDPRYVDFNAAFYKFDSVCTEHNGGYNTAFVTKGAIFSPKYLTLYFGAHWEKARSNITKYVTGEDLLMSAVLARFNVVAVSAKGRWKNIKHTGTNLGQRSSRFSWRVL